MVKRYEWKMVSVARMDDADREGWEYVDGPAWEGGGFACLMRREVVPGRVTSPAVEISGVHVQPDGTKTPVRLNCWTCKHSNATAKECARAGDGDMARVDWIGETHLGADQCPRDADGCPRWTAKEAT